MWGAPRMGSAMTLTPEQHAAVQQWASDGATLNDVQRRLKEEFGVNITYLDARLLLLDLQVQLKDKPKAKEPVPPEPAPELGPDDALPDDSEAAEMPLDGTTGEPGTGQVRLTVDQIAIPGAVVSGKVTFSDGQNAGWYLDQMGRLGLGGVEPGYKPPALDVPVFQQELDRVLMEAGF